MDGEDKDFIKVMVKAENDPVFFIHDILGVPEIFPKQEKLIRDFYSFKYDNTPPKYSEMAICGGMRCISKYDTLIPTSNGLKYAFQITPTDYLWDGESYQPPSFKYESGVKETLKIQTKYGFNLIATPEHKIMTPDGFKELRMLSVGDKVRVDVTESIGGNINIKRWRSRPPKIKSWNVPNKLNEDIAMLLGYLTADHGKSENIEPLFNKLFNTTSPNDTHMAFLKHLGHYPEEKEVPYTILQSPIELRRAFLRAFFESDGCSSCEMDTNRSVVRCYTNNINTAYQIQQMLLMDGILSAVYTSNGNRKRRKEKYYNMEAAISISGRYINEFKTRIGFISDSKCELLSKHIAEMNKKPRRRAKRQINWVSIKSITSHGHIPTIDFGMPIHNQYSAGGIIVHNSGKTAMMGMIGAYEFFDCISKPDPAKHYGLLPKQLVSLSCCAASEKQALDGIFYNIKTNLENSEFINQWWDIDYRVDRIVCRDKRVQFRVMSSNINTAVGRSHKAVIYDELDLFEETEGNTGVWNYYNRLNKSTVTFKEYGFSFAISSPIRPNGIILTLVQRANQRLANGRKARPQTFAEIIPTWEFNPYLTKKELMRDYQHDLATFWRDFGCDPSATGNAVFPTGIKLSVTQPNLLDQYSKNSSQYPHVLAIDPAMVGDNFGIAIAYYDFLRNMYVVDGVKKIEPPDGGLIQASKVREVVSTIIKNFNVNSFVFDAWLFPDLIEYVTYELGIETIKHVVDKEDYDRIKEYIDLGKVEITYNDLLEYEANRLQYVQLATKVRVDHPKNGSKDVSDCVANCLWYLSSVGQSSSGLPIAYIRGFS